MTPKKIITALEASGKTRYAIAKETGIAQSILSRIMSGPDDRRSSISTVIKLQACASNHSPDLSAYFITKEKEESSSSVRIGKLILSTKVIEHLFMRMMAKTKEVNGCTYFTGSANREKNGYGIVWYRSRHIYAHRLSYIFNHGEIPEGMLVMHKCDNPLCVNGNHLMIGTHQDNVDDMNRKCRGRWSSRNKQIAQKGVTQR